MWKKAAHGREREGGGCDKAGGKIKKKKRKGKLWWFLSPEKKRDVHCPKTPERR